MITTRSATRDDLLTLAHFQVLMAKETEDMDLDPAVVNAGVTAVFDDPTKGEYLLAVDGDRLVGCLLTLPEWSDWRNGTVLWIHSVYVIPEARQQGVFGLLYGEVKARVESDQGLRGIRLYVEHANERAQQVYRRMGMTDQHYRLFEWLQDG